MKVHWGIYIWHGTGYFLLVHPAEFGFAGRTSDREVRFINRTDRAAPEQGRYDHRGVLGRMLNYGKVVVRGTGVSASPFGPISQPLDFKRAIEEAEATEAK
jgi:hypothetical protein